jgi:hypothetical protein
MREFIVLLVLALTAATPLRARAGQNAGADSLGQPAPAKSHHPAGLDPRRLLPGNDAIPGWVRSEDPRIFSGKTLFAYIDGGAEEFLAQGFRDLTVGGYRKDSLEVVAEIYHLGSRKGATAILEARGGSAESPTVGEACALDSMQILFRREGFFVSVTGFEKKPAVAATLRALSDSIDARIRAAISKTSKKE